MDKNQRKLYLAAINHLELMAMIRSEGSNYFFLTPDFKESGIRLSSHPDYLGISVFTPSMISISQTIPFKGEVKDLEILLNVLIFTMRMRYIPFLDD